MWPGRRTRLSPQALCWIGHLLGLKTVRNASWMAVLIGKTKQGGECAGGFVEGIHSTSSMYTVQSTLVSRLFARDPNCFLPRVGGAVGKLLNSMAWERIALSVSQPVSQSRRRLFVLFNCSRLSTLEFPVLGEHRATEQR
ncbi:hypothetical protein BO71DRAFT_7873 [Aspergillus ellipticus CBS 707.79]|uniref:Uncharacterized protein n=1 Tax=Aspergillus ellipticus CBS 707.79 TaxID=1448320 RepID=A0A319DFQ4_9EURO|nr:hypothetical protein BO71DRAFT_7873 [Aspergillus ellipticus CBS 707.79]